MSLPSQTRSGNQVLYSLPQQWVTIPWSENIIRCQAHIWNLISLQEAVGLVPEKGCLSRQEEKWTVSEFTLRVPWLCKRLLLALRRYQCVTSSLEALVLTLPLFFDPQLGIGPEQAAKVLFPVPILSMQLHTSTLAHPLNPANINSLTITSLQICLTSTGKLAVTCVSLEVCISSANGTILKESIVQRQKSVLFQ